MRGIVKACRRTPAVRPRDRNGGFPRLVDGGFRTASPVARGAPHRHATRSLPKALGGRLYVSLLRTFGITRDFRLKSETGSLETACTASKSLISQKTRAGFELPVRFAAVRGPWRPAAARAGPGERGLSAPSAVSQTFSLLANFEVRFSRAISHLACVTRHELSPPTGCRVSVC